MTNIKVHYFARLRYEAKIQQESISLNDLDTCSIESLYTFLQDKYNFSFSQQQLRVALNEEFCDWSAGLTNDDVVAFIPPVSGG